MIIVESKQLIGHDPVLLRPEYKVEKFEHADLEEAARQAERLKSLGYIVTIKEISDELSY